MPYITTAEKIGIEKGKKEGERNKSQNDIIEILETLFESVPASLKAKIKKIEGIEALSTLLKKAVLAKDLEEFESSLKIL